MLSTFLTLDECYQEENQLEIIKEKLYYDFMKREQKKGNNRRFKRQVFKIQINCFFGVPRINC